jgi:group I intron endonuclease
MVVYKAENLLNGKVYIGKTILPLERRIMHHEKAKTGLFPSALRKYGRAGFAFSVLDTAESDEELLRKETQWIAVFKSKVPNGYNLTDGGEGMAGYRATEETRRKMSLSSKGKNAGPKNGMYGKSTWIKGRRHTEEANSKNSERHKELWQNPEYRERLSMAHRGKKQSEETKRKRVDAIRHTLEVKWQRIMSCATS